MWSPCRSYGDPSSGVFEASLTSRARVEEGLLFFALMNLGDLRQLVRFAGFVATLFGLTALVFAKLTVFYLDTSLPFSIAVVFGWLRLPPVPTPAAVRRRWLGSLMMPLSSVLG